MPGPPIATFPRQPEESGLADGQADGEGSDPARSLSPRGLEPRRGLSRAKLSRDAQREILAVPANPFR